MTVRAELLEDGTLLRLTLDKPKGNVLDAALMRELGAALHDHRDRAALRLVAITGAGSHFSFGASIEEHRREQAPAMLATFHALVRDLAAYPVPVAALVSGRCLGGAFELALCCHLVFAAPGAVFACPEIKLAVFPPVLAAVGHLRLGGALAERMLLTGEELDAAQAQAAGFARVLDGDPWDGLLAWYRATLRPLSPFALREGTRATRAGSGLLDALADGLAAIERQYLERVVPSHDGNEGIEAYLMRRPPQWQEARG